MTALSIIIPVLNESPAIIQRLKALRQLTSHLDCEVILVDGGSQDDTVLLAEPYVHKVLTSPKGRARQMNSGAAVAKGRFLLFLHADTELPEQAFGFLDKPCDWGFYPLRLSGGAWMFRVIERMINLRSRFSQIATGDQCLFVRRELFESISGMANIPLMEDVEITRRLRSRAKPYIETQPVVTSSRKWEREGIFRTILLMWYLRTLYALGVSPSYLVKKYYR